MMKIQSMMLDKWTGPRCQDTTVQEPAWEEVEHAVLRLDANRYTCLSLLGINGVQLVIGGGGGQFVLTANLDDDTHLVAVDESKPKHDIELTVGGQTGIYTAQMIWGQSTALSVARLFSESNELDARMRWTKA
jgi:hypothetical protein